MLSDITDLASETLEKHEQLHDTIRFEMRCDHFDKTHTALTNMEDAAAKLLRDFEDFLADFEDELGGFEG